MYSFRKIPHLRQGVLSSEFDTQFSNFEHPNVRRGQPNLLRVVQRKKQPFRRADDALELPNRDYAHNVPFAAKPLNISARQISDIRSILDSIAAIKTHQLTLSTELDALKDHLWQEAITAQENEKKKESRYD
jgi:heat shock transcription factor